MCFIVVFFYSLLKLWCYLLRHHVYEVQTANTFPLGPTENIAEAPRLQFVLWAPYNNHQPQQQQQQQSSNGGNNNGVHSASINTSASSSASTSTSSLNTVSSTVSPTPTTGSLLLNSLGGGASVANLVKPPPPIQLQQQNQDSASQQTNGNRALAQNQAIAFVHENDIYYKPKVQGELVCRITTSGRFMIIVIV